MGGLGEYIHADSKGEEFEVVRDCDIPTISGNHTNKAFI